HLLDPLGKRRRFLPLGLGLLGERLVARLMLVGLVADRGAAPGAELRGLGHAQQILGRGSPASMSTTREPPKEVSSRTRPGGSGLTSAIVTLPSPSGCERRAARASSSASGATTATSFPSLAT